MLLTGICALLGGFLVIPLVVAVSLKVQPNRAQFFVHDSFLLGCDSEGNPSDWRVRRMTKDSVEEDLCSSSDQDCLLDLLYPADSGLYWCEREDGELSDALDVVVTGGAVILDSPALPVTEGETVTLICQSRDQNSSSSTSRFYKNDALIGSSSTGNLSVFGVSRSDQGLYRCNMSGVGESALSRLTVRGRPESDPVPWAARVLLPVVGVCLAMGVLVVLLRLCRIKTGAVERAVSYTDVTVTRRRTTRMLADLDSERTFYSTLNLENL
ncbi:unnamed protein product [Ophioblennius macclurei]